MDILSFSKTDLIKSLHKNNLLKPFIKSTISSKEIEDVILSDEDFNKQKENFFRTYNISNEKDKEDFLKKNSMKEDQLLEQISTQAKLKTYLLKNFKAKAANTWDLRNVMLRYFTLCYVMLLCVRCYVECYGKCYVRCYFKCI